MDNKRKVKIGDIILWEEWYGMVVVENSYWLQVRFFDKPEQEWIFSKKEAKSFFKVIST